MKPSGMFYALLKGFEKLKSAPYKDPKGVPTIGWGSTYYENGKRVSMADKPITREEADRLLERTVENVYMKQMNKLVAVPLLQCQYDATLDFLYNVGFGHFEGSKFQQLLNAGMFRAAADEMLRWEKGAPGLKRRREAERKLFLSGMGAP